MRDETPLDSPEPKVVIPILRRSPPAERESPARTAFARGMAVEARALEFLLEKPGISYLDRNYRAKSRSNRAEIDLIVVERSGGSEARERCELVFVEVRSRIPRADHSASIGRGRKRAATGRWPKAEETVDGWKRRCLRRAIEHFLHYEARRVPADVTGIRLDLVAWDGGRFQWFRSIEL